MFARLRMYMGSCKLLMGLATPLGATEEVGDVDGTEESTGGMVPHAGGYGCGPDMPCTGSGTIAVLGEPERGMSTPM